MVTANAAHSGEFLLGGKLGIHRLGYGAMRVTGLGVWGEPADRAEVLRTLRRARELGINFIDTADAYGPDVSEFRRYDDELAYCEAHDIGFIPWYPLSGGALLRPDSLIAAIAQRHHASPSRISLAWLLQRSPVMLPIPGTSQCAHLEENIAAADIVLSDEDYAEMNRLADVHQKR